MQLRCTGRSHYNYFRDYDPVVGRYIQSDPILQPTRAVIDGELAFLVPFLIGNPAWLHPYTYVANQPLGEIDPKGLGPLDLIKCFYYGNKVTEAAKQCRNECGTSTEDEIKFMQKWGSNSLSGAQFTCTCDKAGPELCVKWLTSCFKIAPGPMPRPRL